MRNKLNELSVLVHSADTRPVHTTKIFGKNVTLYSSSKLESDFQLALDAIERIHPEYATLLRTAMSRKILVPVTASSGSYTLLTKKMFRKIGIDFGSDRSAVAFFSPTAKKIFLITDNTALYGSEIFVDYASPATMDIVAHEFMHYLAYKTPARSYYSGVPFLKTFYTNLFTYYTELFIWLKQKTKITSADKIISLSDVIHT